MKTKIELECALLMAGHDLKNFTNNRSAWIMRENCYGVPFSASLRKYCDDKIEEQKQRIAHLENAIAAYEQAHEGM